MKNKFYHDPKWKVATPNRWVCKQDFKTGIGSTWTKSITNSTKDLYEPHIDGLDVLGDVNIKRKINKEMSQRVFTSTVKNDP